MNLRCGKNISVFFLSIVVAGCGGSMTLKETAIPTPLVDVIPIHVGLKIDPELYSFSREEKVMGRKKWSIDMGDANARLFVNLFEYLFEDTSLVDENDEPSTMPIDALIDVSIDAFEFSIPEQTGTDSFAIWIRYRLKVFDQDGLMVANWPVSAYGKSESKTLASSASLENAAVLAMRDAAALMVMKLDRETGISSLGTTKAARNPTETQNPVEMTVPDDNSLLTPGGN